MNTEELREIEKAIQAEVERTPEYVRFKVERRARDGEIWKLWVTDVDRDAPRLDSSLEGTKVWWAKPSTGAADLLSVIVDEAQMNLRFATSVPPGKGEYIRVYLPEYLEKLLQHYRNAEDAERSLAWYERSLASNECSPEYVPSANELFTLRENQAEAFRLVGYDAGWLWGPPGTGKTYTLGALLASFLLKRPKGRVLLLSTTNNAVDLALVAVARALDKLGLSPAESPRTRCKRVGAHYIARNYADKEHLLPTLDMGLVKKLIELEARRPDREKVQDYAKWKQSVEQVQEKLKAKTVDVLERSRLVAMTTTRAVFDVGVLRQFAPFDLVVFDESSQVSIPHALAIAPLGTKVLFTGDPKQLAPIVQSNLPTAKTWLGRSMMDHVDEVGGASIMLEEQSRMVEPVCEIVSRAFYGGKLRVAGDAVFDDMNTDNGLDSVRILEVEQKGRWSPKFRSTWRDESADAVVSDVVAAVDEFEIEPNEILVLTPFRAQQTIVRQRLRRAGWKQVRVSTVHRAQGTESLYVVFDPVDGSSPFLRNDEARRIINVGLSRARYWLTVVLSPHDRENELLNRIGCLIEAHKARQSGEFSTARDIGDLIRLPDFPTCIIGKVIKIMNAVGRVEGTEAHNANVLLLRDSLSGECRRYRIDHLKKNFG